MSRLVSYASRVADSGADTGRRSFLFKLAMISTALVVAPKQFLFRPVSAQAAVCGPAPGCNDGYSAFCCTVNRGINNCPPGHVMGGWWRAENSSYCLTPGGASKARYYIDCHPRCDCTNGCGKFCTSTCYACSCECPDTATCDKRHTCCAVFRYGQCNTHIGCIGPVTCRVVTCTPPYQLFDVCGKTLLSDDFTANQTAECLGVGS
jgi:hypothetical protein